MDVSPRSIPIACDSAELTRLLLGVASASGADARQLARDAAVPDWAPASGHAMLPSRLSVRLFELVERALDDPHVALTVPERHQVGDLDLYDYLFITAATLRDGLRASADFIHLISTNDRIQVEEETGNETTYAFGLTEAAGRGRELMLQFAVTMMCARATMGTGQPVMPTRVGFSFSAPRSHRVFTEVLGTRQVDFDCPSTTFTFSSRDLDLPMRGSDPKLAAILADYAGTLPPPPIATWREHFRLVLVQALASGSLSLSDVASRLDVSRRTLQRQLADHGTTWRAELEAARLHRAGQIGGSDVNRLARELGYADPRSARRAVQRWRGRER